jgi:antitoxin ParD1/3/4
MSAERVTVSLPSEVLAQARGAVAAGEAESVSAYVAQALAARQAKAQALATLDEVLGGRPPVAALNEVRAQLGLPLLPTA